MERKQKEIIKKALAKFSKQEFQELLLTLMVGMVVRTAVLDASGDEWLHVEDQVDDFLKIAEELGYHDFVEHFDKAIIPSDKLCKKEEKILEEYGDMEFWEELELRMGQRDFYDSLTGRERQVLDKELELPEKVHEYYDKYRREFEENGIDNLEIINKRKN